MYTCATHLVSPALLVLQMVSLNWDHLIVTCSYLKTFINWHEHEHPTSLFQIVSNLEIRKMIAVEKDLEIGTPQFHHNQIQSWIPYTKSKTWNDIDPFISLNSKASTYIIKMHLKYSTPFDGIEIGDADNCPYKDNKHHSAGEDAEQEVLQRRWDPRLSGLCHIRDDHGRCQSQGRQSGDHLFLGRRRRKHPKPGIGSGGEPCCPTSNQLHGVEEGLLLADRGYRQGKSNGGGCGHCIRVAAVDDEGWRGLITAPAMGWLWRVGSDRIVEEGEMGGGKGRECQISKCILGGILLARWWRIGLSTSDSEVQSSVCRPQQSPHRWHWGHSLAILKETAHQDDKKCDAEIASLRLALDKSLLLGPFCSIRWALAENVANRSPYWSWFPQRALISDQIIKLFNYGWHTN